MRLALDAMGGDHAPEMVVRGAELAIERQPDLELVMVGDSARIQPLIDTTTRLKSADLRIIHTDKAVLPSDKPSIALRSGRDSSMRLAINLVADGEADGIVSAGNTGALMAMSKIALKMVPQIDRPAIASFFPTMRGESCMLDLGANVECDAENLVQFALMGEVFARIVADLERPTVGLLNVGSEEQKGHAEVREAAAVLREIKGHFDFKGFVEGDDITAGTVDVIVTDGFSGNIALKTAEGTSRMMTHFLRHAFKSTLLAKIGYLLCRPGIEHVRQRMDPRRYNGAVFLGVNGIAVKSHGGTDELGFANAIGVAADMARYGFIDRVMEELETVGPIQASLSTNDKAAAS